MTQRVPFLSVRSLRLWLVLILALASALAVRFVRAGREAPSAWRSQLEASGSVLTVEHVRAPVEDERNAAQVWKRFEDRFASGDPVFLRDREISPELLQAAHEKSAVPFGSPEVMTDWRVARSIQALRSGTSTDADRALLEAGLARLADDLDQLHPLLERPAWSFDEARTEWDPKLRQNYSAQLFDRNHVRIIHLGDRGRQLDHAIDWVSVRALLSAERSNAEAAARELLLAWHLIDAFRSEPFAPEYFARIHLEWRFQATLSRVLPEMAATPEALELERRLATFDMYADLAQVFRSRRIELLAWFERELVTPWDTDDDLRQRVNRALFAYDVRACSNAFESWIAVLEENKHEALREYGSHIVVKSDLYDWIAPSVRLILGHELSFPEVTLWIQAIQMRNDLLRVELADRLRGRDAALELAKELSDLADGNPLRQARERDGSVRFWSIGTNWRDEHGAGDDLQIVLSPKMD